MNRTMSIKEKQLLSTLTDQANYRTRVIALFNVVNLRCASEAFHVRVVYGARTKEKQLEIYGRGREQTSKDPAPWGTWIQTGKVVTKALPDKSAHCYRAATDLALIDDVSNEWIHDDHPAWNTHLGSEVKAMGLESGHYWHFKDSAHNELTNWRDLVRDGVLKMFSMG